MAELASKALRVFEEKDIKGSGLISKADLQHILKRLCGLEDGDIAKFLAKVSPEGKDGTSVKYSEFVRLICGPNAFADARSQRRRLGEESHARVEAGLQVTTWNVKSPELGGNLLEMHPGWSALPNPEHAGLLDQLFELALDLLVSSASLSMADLLQDRPIEELQRLSQDSPEAQRLSVAPKQLEGLKSFFAVRNQLSDDELDSFVDTWLRDPAARWAFWREQSARDFIADDGSGGKAKINEVFPDAPKPRLDDVAWDLALGVADQRYRFVGGRARRTAWMHPTGGADVSGHEPFVEDGTVRHDFFKLLVWDMLLDAVHERASQEWHLGPCHWDSTFADVKQQLSKCQSAREVEAQVIQLIASFQSDIIVLTEISKSLLGEGDSENKLTARVKEAGGPWYRMFTAQETDTVSNTVILARAEQFAEGVIVPFVTGGENGETVESCRNLEVRLKAWGGQHLHVIGVHLSSGNHGLQEFFDDLESRLEDNKGVPTVVAGDFNFDFREAKSMGRVVKDKAGVARPAVQELLETSRPLWDQDPKLGTVSKKRTLFQAQVSKMAMPDFSMKDFILVSRHFDLSQKRLKGLIYRAQLLPDASMPSDHNPITLESVHSVAAVKQPEAPKAWVDPTADDNIRGVDEETLLSVTAELGGLSRDSMDSVSDQIKRLKSLQLCRRHFDRSPEADQDKVRALIRLIKEGLSGQPMRQRRGLNRSEFRLLHDSVRSLFAPQETESQGSAAEKVFLQVDCAGSGEARDAEIMYHLVQVAKGQAEAYPQWKRFTSFLDDVVLRSRAHVELQKYERAGDLMRTAALYNEAYIDLLKNCDVFIKSENDADFWQPELLWISGVADDFSACHGSYHPRGTHNGAVKYNNEETGAILYLDSNCWKLHVRDDTTQHSYFAPARGGPPPTAGWVHATKPAQATAMYATKSARRACTECVVLQPVSFDDFIRQGQDVYEIVEEFAEEVKERVQAPFWSMGPLKDRARAEEKIRDDYKGDARRLVDVVRFSIVCEDLPMVSQAIQEFKSDARWGVVRVKSGFHPQAPAAPTTSSGYRDVKVNLRHLASGHVVEAQLHVLSFYRIQQESGYRLYSWGRTFSVEGITSAEDVLTDLSPDLLKEMAGLAQLQFDKVARRFGPNSKKGFQKRMVLFECLRLTRNKKKLMEEGQVLLGNIGEASARADLDQRSVDRVEGIASHDIAETLLMIGKAHGCVDAEKQEALLEKATRTVMDRGMGPDSTVSQLLVARCKCAIGNLYWGKPECIGFFKDAVAFFQACGLPDRHPMVAKTNKNLGAALVVGGDVEEGRLHLESAEAAYTDLYGSLDHRTATTLIELGIAFRASDKVKSLWYLERCLTSRRLRFGEHDERVGNVYFEMALVKLHHKDTKGALEDFMCAVDILDSDGVAKKREREGQKFDRLLPLLDTGSAHGLGAAANETLRKMQERGKKERR